MTRADLSVAWYTNAPPTTTTSEAASAIGPRRAEKNAFGVRRSAFGVLVLVLVLVLRFEGVGFGASRFGTFSRCGSSAVCALFAASAHRMCSASGAAVRHS